MFRVPKESPGGSAQCGDPRLQHSLEEDGWVFAGEHVVDGRQRDEGVYQQAEYDGDHVQAELLCGGRQVLDAHDFPSDQTQDPEWGIPTDRQTHTRTHTHAH